MGKEGEREGRERKGGHTQPAWYGWVGDDGRKEVGGEWDMVGEGGGGREGRALLTHDW